MKTPGRWARYQIFQQCPDHGLEQLHDEPALMLERPDGQIVATIGTVDVPPIDPEDLS